MTRRVKVTKAQAAYHEAGHATACAVLRAHFERVTIQPRGSSRGRLYFEPRQLRAFRELPRRAFRNVPQQDGSELWVPNDKPNVSGLRKFLVISAAGGIAQQLYCLKSGEKFGGGHEEDFDGATEIAKRIGEITHGRETVDQLIHWSKDKAAQLMIRHWPSILAVATALLEKETLSAPETRRLIKETKLP